VTTIPEGFNPTVGGDLDLSSLTTIPDGFNPTVGGDLGLSSLTTIPDGFNPTVGGYLDLRLEVRNIGAIINRNFYWTKGDLRYAKIDEMFCELLSEKHQRLNDKDYTIYSAKSVGKNDQYYIVLSGKYSAHGKDLKSAFEDLEFKINAEKIKNNPIHKDTIVSMQHYRLITGACEMGCKQWMAQNGITGNSMRADELLKLLEKTNAYGLDRFKKLVSWTSDNKVGANTLVGEPQ
jgi:hypothetical protein